MAWTRSVERGAGREICRLLELPALERPDRRLERGALLGVLGAREEALVRVDGEVERFVVVLRAGEAGRVVGEDRLREVVLGEAGRHLPPPLGALARVRLGEGPEVPGAAVGRV